MNSKVIELYGRDELAKARGRLRAVTALCAVIGALTLAFCILCCVKAGTHDRTRLMLYAIAASTLGGWAIIAVRVFWLARLKNEKKHIEAITSGARERIEGWFAPTGERFRVINGVGLTRIAYSRDDEIGTLGLWSKKEKSFDSERAAAVYTSQGFITAYEVQNEGD